MYAGRVACCPLASHVEFAPRALSRLENRWDRRADGGQTDTLRILYRQWLIRVVTLLDKGPTFYRF